MATAPATTQLPRVHARSDGRGSRLLGPYSDRRLVARVRAGDEAAFERIFDRYAAGLLSFCRHMLGSREEAEDAVQQTFVSAHRALVADDREIHLRAWLFAIARNRCLSMLRARRDELALDAVEPARVSTAGLASEVERREDLRELLVDVARLPEDQRAALVLAELGAHSHQEIADVLGVRREKVKALVFQAREALAAAREARATPCEEIRHDLATLRGSALRRSRLRRHLDHCAGCRAFREEVNRQHAAFALLLPVVPTGALKASVLGGGAAAGGGSLLFGAKGATKLLSTLALTGVAGGGGYVAVTEVEGRSPAKADTTASAPAPATSAAAGTGPGASVAAALAASLPRPGSRQGAAGATRTSAAPGGPAPAAGGATGPGSPAPGAAGDASGHDDRLPLPALLVPGAGHALPVPSAGAGTPAMTPASAAAPGAPDAGAPPAGVPGPPSALPPQAAADPAAPSGPAGSPASPTAPGRPATTPRPSAPPRPSTSPAPAAPGPPENAGAPAGAGPPENAGAPAGAGPPASAGPPADAGRPADVGPPSQAAAPASAGPPANAGANANGSGHAKGLDQAGD